MKTATIAAVVVAVVCVVALNVVLLSFGGNRNDPVGRLTPRATIPAPTTTTQMPTTTVPQRRHRHQENDD